jgi:CheY-like chemotaxis protein
MIYPVLVIDDDYGNREILRAILEDEGYLIDSAQDGDSALRQLAHRSYDLIIIDYFLPDMTGYELISKIGRTEQVAATPVLVVTAGQVPSSEIAHFSAVITKPFLIDDCLPLIRDLLTRGKPGATGPEQLQETERFEPGDRL